MQLQSVIPEIDIWRTAQLMLNRYGDKALEESAVRADELVAARDPAGRGGLVSDYQCGRSAREHDTSRASALTRSILVRSLRKFSGMCSNYDDRTTG